MSQTTTDLTHAIDLVQPESAGRLHDIPFDPQKPSVTSGIRLGTPAATTRGFGPSEFRTVCRLIADVLDAAAASGTAADPATETRVRAEVIRLCERFPIYNRLTYAQDTAS